VTKEAILFWKCVAGKYSAKKWKHEIRGWSKGKLLKVKPAIEEIFQLWLPKPEAGNHPEKYLRGMAKYFQNLPQWKKGRFKPRFLEEGDFRIMCPWKPWVKNGIFESFKVIVNRFLRRAWEECRQTFHLSEAAFSRFENQFERSRLPFLHGGPQVPAKRKSTSSWFKKCGLWLNRLALLLPEIALTTQGSSAD